MKQSHDLRRCTGYRVDTRDGSVGIVAAVLPRAGVDRRGVLLVHSGPIYCNLAAIPFAEIQAVDVDEGRVLLRRRRKTMREAAQSGVRNQACTHP
jgi:hypothetical protein